MKSGVKAPGSTGEVHWKPISLRIEGDRGIPGVAVKCVDIRKNTGGEGDDLSYL